MCEVNKYAYIFSVCTWICTAFGLTICLMPVCLRVFVCVPVCVCMCSEQLRYRACRGREVISAEDDCIIWTAD